ncbi:hypothetical protein D1BOALGB6SA_1663 [Olavius sp. associated proteobacterium Delta 1]|nr:hypothetical protein D1BOALGB6SA_1663 [Olavius sp. associated proteobacterium Delta 1]
MSSTEIAFKVVHETNGPFYKANDEFKLSGTAEVLDDRGVCLSRLSKSDVFGEMSLISGNPVGATIKVAESATVVTIAGADFKEILKESQGRFKFSPELPEAQADAPGVAH